METFPLYLFKSVVWLAGFSLVFILFLRNERFFVLNRFYLLAGILTSFILPFVSIHYTVVLHTFRNFQVENAVVTEIQNPGHSIIPDVKQVLLILYMSGVLFVLALIIRQGRSVLRAIKKAEIISFHQAKLIKTPDYTSAFSFFSYVFINPSVTDIETKEIMIHELVHIRQKHWFDLLLVELLCMMQWFNPLVWIYIRFIRQNHEYLADEEALQHTSDPAVYRAVLLNQIVGAPVVSLANSFNYSPNKKRFNMMKNIISSPYRKMKILLILPVFAIVLYAFAKPDYKYKYVDESSGNIVLGTSLQQNSVKGTVVQQDGKPLAAANIIITGTTTGTITDAKGNFRLENIPKGESLVISYVGFKSKVLKPDFTSEMSIIMVRDTARYNNLNLSTPPPPPPPPPPPDGSKNGWEITAHPSASDPGTFKVTSIDGKTPLIVVDGKIVSANEADKIDPETIESIYVLKDKSATEKPATDKYGEKGKDGVIEITLKNSGEADNKMVAPPPPPPPLKGIKFRGDGPPPLYVVDGNIISEEGLEKINPDAIESITVLKAKSATVNPATDKYGEKGKDGVIEITLKNSGGADNKMVAPPPPPLNLDIKSEKATKLYYVVDGVGMGKEFNINSIKPNAIENIEVTKQKSKVSLYGGTTEDGVILITTKKNVVAPAKEIPAVKAIEATTSETQKEAFIVVEKMPEFPGGKDAMDVWINANLKYPAEALKNKITGKVLVNFTVTWAGKIKNVVVSKSVSPLLDAEAIRVISSMPEWKPASQGGKPVDVQYCVPVEFKLQ